MAREKNYLYHRQSFLIYKAISRYSFLINKAISVKVCQLKLVSITIVISVIEMSPFGYN